MSLVCLGAKAFHESTYPNYFRRAFEIEGIVYFGTKTGATLQTEYRLNDKGCAVKELIVFKPTTICM